MKRPPATGAFFTGAAFTGTTIMQHSSARPNSNALFSRASLFYLAVLIVGAGIIGAILHRKRDATATQLVEITPMSSMTLDPAHVRSSTGGYDMRPIEGLPVQAQAIPVQAQAMPVDVQTTPVEVQAKL